MQTLVLGLAAFLIPHSLRIFAEPWRGRMLQRLGEGPWKILYSLVSLGGLALLVWGYANARHAGALLWAPPAGMRHATVLLMLFSFVLLVAAYVPGNRIRAGVGHPMLLGIALWAVAHLLANGSAPDVLLFAAFLAWSLVAYFVARTRDRAAGRTIATAGLARDAITLIAGLAGWAFFAHVGHLWLIGVRPMG